MLKLYQPTESQMCLGLHRVATYQPDWVLPNAWYQSIMARKFERHTGIQSRAIADVNEVELACRAIRNLLEEARCDLQDCAGIVFSSPSLIPQPVARRLMPYDAARREQPNRVAQQLATELDLSPRKLIGINGFCSGYAKAMQLVQHRLAPKISLKQNEFVLAVTSSRISRITDFACKQSGALFGDFATATMLTRVDSIKYPPHLELVDAAYERKQTARPFFDFHCQPRSTDSDSRWRTRPSAQSHCLFTRWHGHC